MGGGGTNYKSDQKSLSMFQSLSSICSLLLKDKVKRGKGHGTMPSPAKTLLPVNRPTVYIRHCHNMQTSLKKFEQIAGQDHYSHYVCMNRRVRVCLIEK